ncbi:MAG TPA: DUF2726 domain-containing protein [Candidatus Acidoferrales bacterium]|nr:DUF2726 domain-containing protein [Candidatus Acidoferrales bacterium]
MASNRMLDIELFTNDENIRSLCCRYWALNAEGRFLTTVRELGAEFGIEANSVPGIIRANSRAIDTGSLCNHCGSPTIYWETRSQFSFGRWRGAEGRLCKDCTAVEKQLEEEERKNERQRRREEMDAAVERGTYESLSDLEFNLLLALTRVRYKNEAFKAIGVGQQYGAKMFKKLQTLSLADEDESHWWLAPSLYTILQNVAFRRKAKSIFGSPLAKEAYRQLKAHYGFVFPEVAICAFIEKATVCHLFTESWHSGYFLTCRIDFVICDEDGKPVFCVEFQGSYHRSGEQTIKDQFKETILAEAGIALQQWTAQDVRRLWTGTSAGESDPT